MWNLFLKTFSFTTRKYCSIKFINYLVLLFSRFLSFLQFLYLHILISECSTIIVTFSVLPTIHATKKKYYHLLWTCSLLGALYKLLSVVCFKMRGKREVSNINDKSLRATCAWGVEVLKGFGRWVREKGRRGGGKELLWTTYMIRKTIYIDKFLKYLHIYKINDELQFIIIKRIIICFNK